MAKKKSRVAKIKTVLAECKQFAASPAKRASKPPVWVDRSVYELTLRQPNDLSTTVLVVADSCEEAAMAYRNSCCSQTYNNGWSGYPIQAIRLIGKIYA